MKQVLILWALLIAILSVGYYIDDRLTTPEERREAEFQSFLLHS